MEIIKYLGTRKIRSKLLYFIKIIFYVIGKNWNDFYAWMIDFQDRKLTLQSILKESRSSKTKYKGLWDWRQGDYFIKYLKTNGLKKNHTVFDLGCGYGRATIPFLKFQKEGYYIGSEISKKRLELAKEWIFKEKLENKNYQLICSKDNDLGFLKDNSINFVWIFSVFNHMPDQILEPILSALYKKIKSDGKIFTSTVDYTTKVKSVKTFPRSKEEIESLFAKHKFKFKFMMDYSEINKLSETKIYMLTK